MFQYRNCSAGMAAARCIVVIAAALPLLAAATCDLASGLCEANNDATSLMQVTQNVQLGLHRNGQTGATPAPEIVAARNEVTAELDKAKKEVDALEANETKALRKADIAEFAAYKAKEYNERKQAQSFQAAQKARKAAWEKTIAAREAGEAARNSNATRDNYAAADKASTEAYKLADEMNNYTLNKTDASEAASKAVQEAGATVAAARHVATLKNIKDAANKATKEANKAAVEAGTSRQTFENGKTDADAALAAAAKQNTVVKEARQNLTAAVQDWKEDESNAVHHANWEDRAAMAKAALPPDAK